MFRNFFKTAIRNLSKNKFFTALNVIGLALGMSLSLLFIALLAFLSRFDNFHPNGDRIYRVTSQLYDKQENPRFASAPAALAQKLQGFTGVEKIVRIHRSLSGNAVYGDKKISVSGYFADPGFFELFNFPLLKGSRTAVIHNPNTIVLGEREAATIFGKKEPVGEIISIEGVGNFLVTGVFKDLPKNSHMDFGAIASYNSLLDDQKLPLPGEKEEWNSFAGSFVYAQLSKEADRGNITHYLDKIAKDEYAQQDVKAAFTLQALGDITPGPELRDPIGSNWSYLILLVTGAITLLVLIPACANYVNLSISQSLERMKEIGVRKVMGGRKKQIMLQFIIESTTIVLVALLLSYVIYEVIRKDFLNQMVETSPIDLSPTGETFVGFLLFALLVGIAAGIVPALYFSRLTPIVALKGTEVKTSGRSFLRKTVLTLQFILSLGFIMAVVIMVRQYQYSISYDLGFEQQRVLDVDLQNVAPQRFKNEFEKLPGVEQVSLSSHVVGIGATAKRYIRSTDKLDSTVAWSMAVDDAFISNLGLSVVAGRGFTQTGAENSRFIVVNEEFVNALQLKNPSLALNQLITLTDSSVFRIAGVVKNFHYAGLKKAIAPFFFEYNPQKFTYANLKLERGEALGSLMAMETLWKKIGGEGKFTARLFSEEIRDAFSFYIMIVKFWGFLGLLAITVACLGLLGTVTFTTKKRVKEIGIRKVLGATVNNLLLLLSKDFAILLLIATVVTVPVVYFLFTYLLAGTQHYSITIGFVEIAISVAILLFLGLATILSQTLKAANANPVDNLRTE